MSANGQDTPPGNGSVSGSNGSQVSVDVATRQRCSTNRFFMSLTGQNQPIAVAV
jgi:hypothetical protein